MDGTTRKYLCTLLILVLVVSCASPQLVDPASDDIDTKIQVGDSVSVTMKNGQVLEFEVLEIGNDALIGKEITTAFAQITQIEVKRFDGTKTFQIVYWVTIGVVVLGVVLIIVGFHTGVVPVSPQ